MPPPRAAEFWSRYNFSNLFWFLDGLMAWPIDYLIWFCSIFVVNLAWIFKVKYGICIIHKNMVRMPGNGKQTYRMNSMGMNEHYWAWPWPWPSPRIFMVNYLVEHMGCESVILDYDRDLAVTKLRNKDLPDSDRSDFRCWHAVDFSSNFVVELNIYRAQIYNAQVRMVCWI